MELFLDAARELMNTNATDFTVQEVVERSGQSLRTFYQYFAGKYELLLALFEESIEGAAARLEEAVATQATIRSTDSTRFCVEYYRMCRASAPGEPPERTRRPRSSSSPSSCSRRTRRRRRTRSLRSSSCSDACSRKPRRRARCVRVSTDGGSLVSCSRPRCSARSAATISASPVGTGDEVLWDLLVHGITP